MCACKDEMTAEEKMDRQELTAKKNIKTYPIPVPPNLRRFVPLRNRNRHGGHMLVAKGETIYVHTLLEQYLRTHHEDYFLKS